MKIIKSSIFNFLQSAGYTVLKNSDYDSINAEIQGLASQNHIPSNAVGKQSHEGEALNPISDCSEIRGDDERLIPGIIFCTMPKSGTVYISNSIASGLRLELMHAPVMHGFFPNYYVVPQNLRLLSRGNRISPSHFDPSPLNIHHVAAYLDRMVLHLRDPRQAALSWTHYYNRFASGEVEGPYYTSNTPPKSYADWTWDQQLDWQLETHLVSTVNWINEWMDFQKKKDNSLKILTTSFESYVHDQEEFLGRILDFYEIPRSEFAFVDLERTHRFNFRKGQTNEWTEIFSDKQKRRCAEIIGPELIERFGWTDM